MSETLVLFPLELIFPVRWVTPIVPFGVFMSLTEADGTTQLFESCGRAEQTYSM